MSKVWAYVDGFNLYNGAVRGTEHKWLDLAGLCDRLMPSSTVERVKYFTASIRPRAGDPDQPIRQQVYWRALRTLDRLEIIEGHFLAKATRLPTVASIREIETAARASEDVSQMKPNFVEVWKAEEKGTDVNLAVHLVNDAHLNRFDQALILSNDSDLCEAIRIVKVELGKAVWVYTPHRRTPSTRLSDVASHFRILRAGVIKASQLPDPITDGAGDFSKPSGW